MHQTHHQAPKRTFCQQGMLEVHRPLSENLVLRDLMHRPHQARDVAHRLLGADDLGHVSEFVCEIGLLVVSQLDLLGRCE